MSEFLKPGWLARQFHEVAIDVATWPAYMRTGRDDSGLTEGQRKEAARRLRERADELDPPKKRRR